jgi:hypothetical protein
MQIKRHSRRLANLTFGLSASNFPDLQAFSLTEEGLAIDFASSIN